MQAREARVPYKYLKGKSLKNNTKKYDFHMIFYRYV